ncbi:Hypothetical protein HDN1F_15450 [gamma proteobacterium HdN1]|nr:Hypothetical protein HDN1F_15450 [gamma proteobacterium HdN1]
MNTLAVKAPQYKTLSIVLLACLCLLAPHAFAAKDPLTITYPDIPPPPGSEWSWVGRQMIVDGTPMSIKVFNFNGTEAELIQHFENFWKTFGHGTFGRTALGNKRMLTHHTAEYYTTVQYQWDGKQFTGSIALSRPDMAKPVPRKLPIKSPPGTTVMSRIESNDLGIFSDSITLLSNRSQSFNVSYYAAQLINDGWTQIAKSCSDTGCNLQFQSIQGQLQISIKDLPGTHGKQSRILVHWIKQ